MKKKIFFVHYILSTIFMFCAGQIVALGQTPTPTPPAVLIRTSGQVCRNEVWITECVPPDATQAPTTSSYQRLIEPEIGARRSSIDVTATATSMQAQMSSRILYPVIGGPATIRNTTGALYVEVLVKDTPTDSYSITLSGTRNVQQETRQATTGWGAAGCPCNSASSTATATEIAPFSMLGTAVSLGGTIVTLSEYPGVNYRRVYSNQFSTGALGIVSNWDDNAGLYAEANVTINLSATLTPPVPPVAILKGPILNGNEVTNIVLDEETTSQNVIFQSLSYDPDNGSGTQPLNGITQHEWMITEPDGNIVRQANHTISHTLTKIGDYQVLLTVTDDEGITATTGPKNFKVTEVIELKLQTVSDADPFNPVVYFSVRGPIKNISIAFDDRLTVYGDRSTGMYTYSPSDLLSLGLKKHRLVLTGTYRGQQLTSEASFDNSPMGYQQTTKSWLISYFAEPGPGTTIQLLGLVSALPFKVHVYKWEWNLPGARWDRLLDGGNQPLSTLYVKAGISNDTFIGPPSISAGFRVVNGSLEKSVGYTPVNTLPSNTPAQDFEIHGYAGFGKAGKTVVGASIFGISGSRWRFYSYPFFWGEVSMTLR